MPAIDRDRRALALFAQAIDMEPQELGPWLEQETGGDTALAGRVLALLQADSAVTFIGTEPAQAMPLPPQQVGVWRLERMIGAGGMGSVWQAVRDDGLFAQTVAIKFMPSRQGGLDLGPLIDAERRSLARMDHEGIARILDGGQVAGGLHYLVMEYVDGVPIAAQGNSRATVALIRQVAAALAHAHQSGIVHCDVKPGNILVTAERRVKLIDFGIARLQDQGAAGGLDGMTRAYASPARCRSEPATLADDVYSLAVTFYELLAGRLPWEAPDRPDPDALARPWRPAGPDDRELAAILAKALARAPANRYRSMDAFDDDLARWQTRRPVSAVPQTPLYLARRLAQRRPVPVAAALLAVLGLVGALAVILNLYLAANDARQVATRRFDDLRSLARFMIFDLNDQLEQLPGATPARLALSEQAQFYLDGLGRSTPAAGADGAGLAGADPDLQLDLARGLIRLAEVQGVPSRPNLGQGAQALANLDRATAILDGLLLARPDDPALFADRGRARYLAAVTRGGLEQDPAGQLALAEAAEGDVLAAQAQSGEGPPPAGLDSLLLGVRLTMADALANLGDPDVAQALREAEEQRILDLPETARAAMDWAFEAGRVAALVGDGHYALGAIDLADAAYARAAESFKTGLTADPLNRKLLTGLHYAHYARSATQADLGDPVAGQVQAEASAAVARRLLDWDPTDRLARQLFETSQGQIALMLRANGQTDAAIAMLVEQVARYRLLAAANPDDAAALRQVAVPLRGLAEMRLAAEGTGQGCAAYQQARAAWATLEARFGLTPADAAGDVALIAAAMELHGC